MHATLELCVTAFVQIAAEPLLCKFCPETHSKKKEANVRLSHVHVQAELLRAQTVWLAKRGARS